MNHPAVVRALSVALLLTPLFAAAAAPSAAGSQLEKLSPMPAADDAAADGPRHCTQDRAWCVQALRADESALATLMVEETMAGAREPLNRAVAVRVPQGARLAVWPNIIRLPAHRVEGGEVQDVLVAAVVQQQGKPAWLHVGQVRHLADDVQTDGDLLVVPWQPGSSLDVHPSTDALPQLKYVSGERAACPADRVFRSVGGRYVPDRPLPACATAGGQP
ncbi:hypothetical protein [Stenotrophomonas sp. ESTM1D_MKCIP4_1]|uniref:hypothetical protein n=1 Tax=Stenotrophomonas sp. ESTM1D_MKCIP4_1 TaxID=2072414 RepID=UPI00131EF643|nr:hypothetical protein [Stenotrophomonas sp. ESTM1D_MKCIP4_1]